MLRRNLKLAKTTLRLFSQSTGPSTGTDIPPLQSQMVSSEQKTSISDMIHQLKFPLKLEGFSQVPEKKIVHAFQQIMAYSNLSEHWLIQHFQKIYYGVLYSMATNDTEFLNEYLEPGLAQAVKDSIQNLKAKDLTVD